MEEPGCLAIGRLKEDRGKGRAYMYEPGAPKPFESRFRFFRLLRPPENALFGGAFSGGPSTRFAPLVSKVARPRVETLFVN